MSAFGAAGFSGDAAGVAAASEVPEADGVAAGCVALGCVALGCVAAGDVTAGGVTAGGVAAAGVEAGGVAAGAGLSPTVGVPPLAAAGFSVSAGASGEPTGSAGTG
ncbi:hypothetical protein D3C72_1777600 [compost metagenome]